MEITVITPTLPERNKLLSEAIASVSTQRHPVEGHLISVDNNRRGPIEIRNQLIKAVDTEWTAFLDDDDILYENHFEVMLPASDSADLIWTWCNSEGRGNFNPNSTFNEKRLREDGNFIPITVAVRTELLNRVGGFVDHPQEDWHLWIRLLDVGARFVNVPVVTWNYRFMGNNRTFG
jgi:glycosyltransferase involved in cell wall biosynthesis